MWYLKPEWVIIWVTIAYTIVSTLALIAIAVQIRVTKDTAKRQLRAYVGVKGAKLFFHEDGSVEARVELFNCGQTPAYDFRGAHLVRFCEYPVPSSPKPPETDMRVSTGILGAGLPYHLLCKMVDRGAGNRERVVVQLSSPKVVFCINGDYTFQDIFKETHRVLFQMIVGGPSGIPRIDKDESGAIFAPFANDSFGNEAD